jgi:hypothetical protein
VHSGGQPDPLPMRLGAMKAILADGLPEADQWFSLGLRQKVYVLAQAVGVETGWAPPTNPRELVVVRTLSFLPALFYWVAVRAAAWPRRTSAPLKYPLSAANNAVLVPA